MKRLLSGIKPTGELTLGNYIGAIRQFVQMQKDYESFVFVADLHALTVYNDPKELKTRIKHLMGVYLACGLDPEYTTLFLQSENMYHANLSWVLECNSYMGELSRMTQYKDKSKGKNNESISCGLFTYPALMAADIMIYDADVVPVGVDQKQHVELARNIAERFNNKYGETFKVPDVVNPKEGAKIYDLQNPTKKMSKTDELGKGCIMLLEPVENAKKKIMSAVTDSENSIYYDKENKPGISNLLVIYSSLENVSIEDAVEKFKNANYGEFKKAVAESVGVFLEDLQSKFNKIVESGMIEEVLDKSNEKVRKIAEAKVKEVFEKVGVGR
ncbi:MAG TPA: tryptophan--tRNA ligase [Firmicutes bacterium]|nr:tryptophan--tRNA ligase [Bacillota bacterium]